MRDHECRYHNMIRIFRMTMSYSELPEEYLVKTRVFISVNTVQVFIWDFERLGNPIISQIITALQNRVTRNMLLRTCRDELHKTDFLKCSQVSRSTQPFKVQITS